MESLLIQKLIILYMLDRIDYTLTNSELCDFMLNKYSNLFNVLEAISELIDAKFISSNTVSDTHHYQITEKGEEALSYFENRLPNNVKQDIIKYLGQEEANLRRESQTYADYYTKGNDEYYVQCVVKNQNETVLDLKLNVTSLNQAIAICNSWQKKSGDIYRYLVDELLDVD